jgi:glycyl-tRNA synthetase beta chain
MNNMKSLLLEIHCEEIPARVLHSLGLEFAEKMQLFINENFDIHPLIEIFYSPRKLAWHIQNIPTTQIDRVDNHIGPPKNICVDTQGNVTKTGLRFADKWGIKFDQVSFIKPANKKELYATATITRKGYSTKQLLAEVLPGMISALHVPKAMRWGSSEFQFIRPIRNILCILGDEVVPFNLDNVHTCNTTWGHRLHHLDHPNPIKISKPDEYEAVLEGAGVIASQEKRKIKLKDQLTTFATNIRGQIVVDNTLLDTLTKIVEYPTVIVGQFPEYFLSLPKELLIASLAEHQKAFCVENTNGQLLPYFLTVANRKNDPDGFIKNGNEWVLKARLYDARFFLEEDCKQSLQERMEKLKKLTFQQELGSYFDKTQRITILAATLAGYLNLNDTHVRLAAQNCKCDLATLMVGEFPELQGIIGGEYLKRENANQAVWTAVKEHYKPVSSDDNIPTTDIGCILALADKLDTIASCFAIGLIPTGSKDPLALRRAGQGIVRILFEKEWNLDPIHLSTVALDTIGNKATKSNTETVAALKIFFRDRITHQLEQFGYSGSIRRTTVAAGWNDLVDLKARCGALADFSDNTRLQNLIDNAKRIRNILKDSVMEDSIDKQLLQEPEEKLLLAHLKNLQPEKDKNNILNKLSELSTPLEAFFSAVMVNCQDNNIRKARFALLHQIQDGFLQIGDFNLWQ